MQTKHLLGKRPSKYIVALVDSSNSVKVDDGILQGFAALGPLHFFWENADPEEELVVILGTKLTKRNLGEAVWIGERTVIIKDRTWCFCPCFPEAP